jgi:hypothetical protein
MKSIFILLALAFLMVNFGYSQSHQNIPVPVLKESKKVDEFMDEVLDPKNAHKSRLTQTSSDSCFWIYFFKANNDDHHFSFQIEKNSKSVVNVLINNTINTNPNVGYFQYKGYKIFVEPDGRLYDFFSKTKATQTFDFIYKLENQQPLANGYYLDIWHYQYKGNHLSIEGPPKVMMLEKN